MPDAPPPSGKLSPILGLPVDETPAAQRQPAVERAPARLELSVIIPARNEEHNLPRCLHSLVAQADEFFALGSQWEIIVVDDDSTDRTRQLAEEMRSALPLEQQPGLRILSAPALDLRSPSRVFGGKTQACWVGAETAEGQWLLFTDADTLHEPGNLRRAIHEAEKYRVAMLSYSPRQIVTGFWQRALMPLIFSELAMVYPPKDVNDPGKRIAAANGQFILIDRAMYFAVDGHRAVGRSVLEDVDLAWNVKKASGRNGLAGLRFRFAPDALSTRMYSGFADMMEGWGKNLALLFPHALTLAFWRLIDLGLLLLPVLIWLMPGMEFWKQAVIWVLWVRTLVRFYARVAKSHFAPLDCGLSVFALPLFVYLLVRSYMNHHLLHQVAWKGREYRIGR